MLPYLILKTTELNILVTTFLREETEIAIQQNRTCEEINIFNKL